MNVYTKCADPVESAARKERLRQAEEQGVLESNAARMIRNSRARDCADERPPELDIDMPSSQERSMQKHTPVSARLGPRAVESPASERIPIAARLGPVHEGLLSTNANDMDRVPISERLGPTADGEVLTRDTASVTAQVKKRKPGRPPGTRKAAPVHGPVPNPLTASRKRKSTHEKPPTGKKKQTHETSGAEPVRPRKVTRVTKNRRGTPRASQRASTPTASENLPLVNMMPPAARRRMDFRGPSSPVP